MESFPWFLAVLFICSQRKWFYLSHQVSSAETSLVRYATLGPLLVLHDGILSGLNFASLLHDAPISVSSYEYQSYCSGKTLFLWRCARNLSLAISIISSTYILEPWWKGFDKDIPLKIECFKISDILPITQLFILELSIIYGKKKFLWQGLS